MLISPFLAPSTIAPYLAAPVWLGFILLLDPINARLGAESLAGDFARGRTDRLINLMLSGLLMGIHLETERYQIVREGLAEWLRENPPPAGVMMYGNTAGRMSSSVRSNGARVRDATASRE